MVTKNKMMPNTEILTMDEFREYMKGKHLYHHVVHWIEKWKIDWRERSPYVPSGFVLDKELKRYPYAGYGEDCKGTETIEGKNYWEDPSYRKVSQTTYAYNTPKTKKWKKIYLTKHK